MGVWGNNEKSGACGETKKKSRVIWSSSPIQICGNSVLPFWCFYNCMFSTVMCIVGSRSWAFSSCSRTREKMVWITRDCWQMASFVAKIIFRVHRKKFYLDHSVNLELIFCLLWIEEGEEDWEIRHIKAYSASRLMLLVIIGCWAISLGVHLTLYIPPLYFIYQYNIN